jgi:uncharacterized membrane protein YgcG
MRFFKLTSAVLVVSLFSTACNLLQQEERVETNPYPNEVVQQETILNPGNYYGRENLDLQAIGSLIQRADNPEELEYLLNSDQRINNLDLNQDGFGDYISVSEFGDEGDGERGLSLFSRFGPDLIQEIATIIFDRGGFNSDGARVLLSGNEQLYGDNNYYEANWLDRALPIISWLFSDRDTNYESPYYYGNYPDYYQPYQIVETPVYQTRIQQVYTEPVFIQMTNPTITQIEIQSPYEGRTLTNVSTNQVISTEEPKEVRRNTPQPPVYVPVRNGWNKDVSPKPEKRVKENPNNFERPQKPNKERFEVRERPNNIRREIPQAPRIERVERVERVERPRFDPPKAQRVERQIFNQPRPERMQMPNMKPPKQENPGRGNGGGNPGNGNGGGNGKGNPGGGNGGGGGGKGGGKKN